jgi:hypothetical protein
LAATKARVDRRQPRPRPAPAREPDVDEFDVPPATTPRAEQPRRPRIAASSAKEAASKRAVRPRRVPARAQQPGRKTNNNDQPAAPSLSGPLARSLLARRLMARKSTQGDGGGKSQRPLRVR